MVQSKYWLVSLDNYTNDDIHQWANAFSKYSLSYFCFQEETFIDPPRRCLQGYICFYKRCRISAVRRILGSVSAVLSNRIPSINRQFCFKEPFGIPGSFQEFGSIHPDPISKNNSTLNSFIQALNNGLRCRRKARELFPAVISKYPQYCYDLIDDYKLFDSESQSQFNIDKIILK